MTGGENQLKTVLRLGDSRRVSAKGDEAVSEEYCEACTANHGGASVAASSNPYG